MAQCQLAPLIQYVDDIKCNKVPLVSMFFRIDKETSPDEKIDIDINVVLQMIFTLKDFYACWMGKLNGQYFRSVGTVFFMQQQLKR